MRALLMLSCLLSTGIAAAQSAALQSDAASAACDLEATTLAPPGGSLALSAVVRGPLDVQAGPFDDRCVGVACAWNYFWVTGRGHSTLGDNRRIHQYDLNGNYLQSFPQVTNSPQWGGRDLEWDPQTFRLWTGADNGEVSEYEFLPHVGPNGTLVHVAIHSVPGMPIVVRALARDPITHRFFAADFNGPIYEFDLLGGVHATYPNPGLAIYGASYDFADGTLWFWSQNASSSPTNLNLASEWDPATATLTGRSFGGLDYAPGIQHIAGGMDIYPDPINPGVLTMAALHQGPFDAVVCYDMHPHTPPPQSYCTAKTTSLGCVPTVTTSSPGNAPEAGGADYHVRVLNVNSQKTGLIFYGLNGPGAAPFQGGYMCMQTPVQRTPVQNSGGGVNNCMGVLDVLVNDPLGLDFAPGTTAWFEGWFRDPASASTTGLSNGLELTMGLAAVAATSGDWVIEAGGTTGVRRNPNGHEDIQVTNNGPSRIRARRLDEKGQPTGGSIHIPVGGSAQIGVEKGQTLQLEDDDGAANGGAKGKWTNLFIAPANGPWVIEPAGATIVVRNPAAHVDVAVNNNGPSRIRARIYDAAGFVVGTTLHIPAMSGSLIGVDPGQRLELRDDDGLANGGASGTWQL